jgi:transposase
MAKHNPRATKKALKLVAEGKTPYAAAKLAKVNPSTIYRALKRQRAEICELKECSGRR